MQPPLQIGIICPVSNIVQPRLAVVVVAAVEPWVPRQIRIQSLQAITGYAEQFMPGRRVVALVDPHGAVGVVLVPLHHVAVFAQARHVPVGVLHVKEPPRAFVRAIAVAGAGRVGVHVHADRLVDVVGAPDELLAGDAVGVVDLQQLPLAVVAIVLRPVQAAGVADGLPDPVAQGPKKRVWPWTFLAHRPDAWAQCGKSLRGLLGLTVLPFGRLAVIFCAMADVSAAGGIQPGVRADVKAVVAAAQRLL